MKNEHFRVVIISGEGAGPGIIEAHTGAPNVAAVKARLRRERCGGDRWAKAVAHVADSEGEDVETGEPVSWLPVYGRMVMYRAIDEAERRAEKNLTPPDSPDWSLGEGLGEGLTVAHTAAAARLLPAGFDNWGIASRTGWTVAHEAARAGRLPDDFSSWTLRDRLNNLTVAHVAADYGHLPCDFADRHPDILELADDEGRTVRDAIRVHAAGGYVSHCRGVF